MSNPTCPMHISSTRTRTISHLPAFFQSRYSYSYSYEKGIPSVTSVTYHIIRITRSIFSSAYPSPMAWHDDIVECWCVGRADVTPISSRIHNNYGYNTES